MLKGEKSAKSKHSTSGRISNYRFCLAIAIAFMMLIPSLCYMDFTSGTGGSGTNDASREVGRPLRMIDITFDVNGGSVPMEGEKWWAVDAYEVPFYPGWKDGLDWLGWSIAGESTVYKAGDKVGLYFDTTFVAVWEEGPKKVNITYDVHGGDHDVPSEVWEYGKAHVLPDNPGMKDGRAFIGWIIVGGYSTVYKPGEAVTVYSDTTFFALYEGESSQVRITFDENGGDKKMYDQYWIVASPHQIPPYMGEKDGYKWIGWQKVGESRIYKSGERITVYEETAFKAIFEPDSTKVTITYNENGGDYEMPTEYWTAGLPHELSTYPGTKDGRAWIGWLCPGDATVYHAGDSLTFYTDTELKAFFEGDIVTVTVTFDENGGDYEMPVDYWQLGSPHKMSPYPGTKDGCAWVGWMKEGDPTVYHDGDFVALYYDTEFKAIFEDEPSLAKITFDINGGDTLYPDYQYWALNESHKVPIYPGTKDGRAWIGWVKVNQGDPAIYKAGNYIIPYRDTTLKALYYGDLNPITITFDNNGGDYDMPTDYWILGQPGKLTPYLGTKDGHAWIGWMKAGDNTLYKSGTFLTLFYDTTFKAIFDDDLRTVTYDIKGATGKVPVQAPVQEGQTFVVQGFTGNPPVDRYFGGWYYDDKTTYWPGEVVTAGKTDITLTAIWNKYHTDYCTITFDVAGGSIPLPIVQVAKDTKYTIPSYGGIRAGCTFDGWNIGGTVYKPGDVITVGQDCTLKAVWTPHTTHHVTYDLADHGYIAPIQDDVPEGGSFTVLPFYGVPEPGYTFVCWTYDGKEYVGGETITMGSSDITLTAKWSFKLHHVTYDVGFSPFKPAPVQEDVAEGGSFRVQSYNGSPYREFKGWDYRGEFVRAGDIIVMGTEDILLTIVWEDSPMYKITYDVDGGSVVIKPDTVASGSHYPLKDYAGTKSGYVFGGWMVDGTAFAPGSCIIITKDITAKAIWEDVQTYHEVTYDANGGSYPAPLPTKVAEGKTFTLEGYQGTKYGYRFSGWEYDGTVYQPGDQIVMGTEDIKLVANWVSILHHVKYDVGISPFKPAPVQEDVPEGSSFTVKDWHGTPAQRELKGWSWNGDVYYPGETITMGTEDILLEAIWVLKYSTVTYDVDGGSVDIDPEKVVTTRNYKIKAYSGVKAGFAFGGWEFNDQIYKPGQTLKITGDITFKAVWNPVEQLHHVTYDVDGGSAAAPTQEDVKEGMKFTVKGYSGTKAGFTFGGWTYDGNVYHSGDEITMGTSDITLVAIWNPVPVHIHKVTYDVNGGSAPAPTQADVEEGKTFTVKEYSGTKGGFTFVGWLYDAAVYNAGDVITMGTADIVLTAQWSATAVHTVSYDANGGSEPAPASFEISEGASFRLAYYNGTIEGYEFKGWSYGGILYAPGTSMTMGSYDMNFVASWEEKAVPLEYHTVTYEIIGGSESAPIQIDVPEGYSFIAAQYFGEKSGYTFDGWNSLGSYYEPGDLVTMGSSDLTLTAVWEAPEDEKPVDTAKIVAVAMAAGGIIILCAAILLRRP